MNKNDKISKKNPAIIGTFTGKCCDDSVMNANGMFLSKELFEKIKDSKEYKDAIENGWYIGYIGHHQNTDDQEFDKGACIVMTDMRMLDDGTIEGDFNLINTPTGQIIKTFIDAGVNFGISIKGEGDVDSAGNVSPDNFMFRGFDLVTFPAYEDAIPRFKVAASTDPKKQANYKKICETINNNLQSITSCTDIEFMQNQLNEHSDEYQLLENRKQELLAQQEAELTPEEQIELLKQKLDAITKLYIEQVRLNTDLDNQHIADSANISLIQANCNRKIDSIRRITASQLSDICKKLDKVEASKKILSNANRKIKQENENNQQIIASLKTERRKLVRANRELDQENQDILASKTENEEKLRKSITASKEAQKNNLIYKRRIDSSNQEIEKKDSIIADLRSQLSQTVTANKTLEAESLNRSDEIKNLKSQITASKNEVAELRQQITANENIIADYQQAYADMCANMIGTNQKISVTASTTVDELQDMIYGNKSINSSSNIDSEPQSIDIVGNEDFGDLISL